MRVMNSTRQREMVTRLQVAENLFTRMKGLLGRRALAEGEGLLIRPCKGIHTFGMRFPIDAVFLDKTNVVIAVWKDLASNRLTRIYSNAASVLELPAGMVDATDTQVGDEIKVA